jgi:hypothetical protein
MRRGTTGTSVRGPESHEGACKYLKGHITLAIDTLFLIFLNNFWGYFQLLLIYLEKYLGKIHLRLLNSGC